MSYYCHDSELWIYNTTQTTLFHILFTYSFWYLKLLRAFAVKTTTVNNSYNLLLLQQRLWRIKAVPGLPGPRRRVGDWGRWWSGMRSGERPRQGPRSGTGTAVAAGTATDAAADGPPARQQMASSPRCAVVKWCWEEVLRDSLNLML